MKKLIELITCIFILIGRTITPKKFRTFRWENRNGKPTSSPFVVIVTSTSDKTLKHIDLLGAFEYLGEPPIGWNWNKETQSLCHDSGITISSAISLSSYKYLLEQIAASKLIIGTTYISTQNSEQIYKAIYHTELNANGIFTRYPLLPLLDPYQQQSTVIAYVTKYRLNGNVKLILEELLPNTTVMFYLYPMSPIGSRLKQIMFYREMKRQNKSKLKY